MCGKLICSIFCVLALVTTSAQADSLIGLADVTVVNGEIVSLRYEGIEYVVANGDLVLGTTTRWYIPAGGVPTLWAEGDAAPAATVAGTSNPKVGDVGSNADNFFFAIEGDADNISSIDGIDFQETVFPILSDTFFLFERGGNDTGTWQAILADGSLGEPVAFSAASVYANTGVNVAGQNAFGVVFKTDVPVKGVRITASGHDTLSISIPAGANPTQAHDPQPQNGAKCVPVNATLTWKTGVDPVDPNVPNPAITGHNLWLSIAYDPMNPPAAPDWKDPRVQIIQIPADTNPADGKVDPIVSYSPAALQRDALYFWIVDESLGAAHPRDWDNIIQGSEWSFETLTSGPEVNAGSSIVTWLEEGITTVGLNGTVTDATGDVTTILWSVVASPFGSTVNIANKSIAATTTTLNKTGRYVLELYAKDAAQNEDSDMMEVNVYGDSCEAAKNNPKGYTAPRYDFNNDCRVDFIDFAMFAATWLQDESLTQDVLYDPGTVFLPPVVQFTNPLNSSTVSGQVTINAIAYDPAVGTADGDGMEGPGSVFFEVISSLGTVLATQNENTATFDMTWNTANTDPAVGPVFPNGVYTIRVTATSDAGYKTIVEISVTVKNL
jgi:hypothetical protein